MTKFYKSLVYLSMLSNAAVFLQEALTFRTFSNVSSVFFHQSYIRYIQIFVSVELTETRRMGWRRQPHKTQNVISVKKHQHWNVRLPLYLSV